MKNAMITLLFMTSFAQAGTMVSGGGHLVNPAKMCPNLTGTYVNGPTANSTATYGYQIKSLKSGSLVVGYEMADINNGNVGEVSTIELGTQTVSSGALGKVDVSVTCKNQALLISETMGGMGTLTSYQLDNNKDLVIGDAKQMGGQVSPFETITYKRQGAAPAPVSTASTRGCIRTPMIRCMPGYQVEKDANGCFRCVPR